MFGVRATVIEPKATDSRFPGGGSPLQAPRLPVKATKPPPPATRNPQHKPPRRACLKLIPHSAFTFAKIWLLAAKLEIRSRRLDAARKILGTALGMAPKHKLFRSYIGERGARPGAV